MEMSELDLNLGCVLIDFFFDSLVFVKFGVGVLIWFVDLRCI